MAHTSSNNNFNVAKRAKKDEFYTQLSDIANELRYYRHHFKNQVVYCNCDNPYTSNFVRYFVSNFALLGLKKLIATSYLRNHSHRLNDNNSTPALCMEYTADCNGDLLSYPEYMASIKQPCIFGSTPSRARVSKPHNIHIEYLHGDGDFRSDECIALLEQADIVVTNPPFSLFRQYVEQLVHFHKRFLILGNLNAITYKEIFKLIKDNRVWLGPSITSGDREFGVPNNYPLQAAGFRVDRHGNKFIRVKGIRWYTNLDHNHRHTEILLDNYYSPFRYPTYDNYNAIEVSRTKQIPLDYVGVMGVPITFLDRYNHQQFEIVGMTASSGYDRHIVGLPLLNHTDARPLLQGKNTYARILIKHKRLSS